MEYDNMDRKSDNARHPTRQTFPNPEDIEARLHKPSVFQEELQHAKERQQRRREWINQGQSPAAPDLRYRFDGIWDNSALVAGSESAPLSGYRQELSQLNKQLLSWSRIHISDKGSPSSPTEERLVACPDLVVVIEALLDSLSHHWQQLFTLEIKTTHSSAEDVGTNSNPVHTTNIDEQIRSVKSIMTELELLGTFLTEAPKTNP